MGHCRTLSHAGTAGLDDNHRLYQCSLLDRLHKGSAVLDRFQIQSDDLGFRIGFQVFQQVNDGQVGAVAVAQELGNSHAIVAGQCHKFTAHSTALGDHGDASLGRHSFQRCHQIAVGVDQSGTVRADTANAILSGDRHDLLFSCCVSSF